MTDKKPAKGSPEAKKIVAEYNAAYAAVLPYAKDRKSKAGKAAHARFEKADKRRWSWGN